MHTNSFLNNCDNIIHAVGPSIDNYYKNEKFCYEKLFETFLNVLVYAEETLKVKSIALPLISSGIFGVPKDVCSEMLYKGLQEFISKTKNKTNRNLICIKIVSIDSPTNDEILKVFKRKLNILKKTESVKEKEEEKIVIEAEVKTVIKEEEEEKHGKCSVCDKEKKLKLSLECGCNYCHLCKDNYYQNGNKCFCPEKEEN
jgi:O-acetyl-ADP-ribose deacetylase (regulator of RNase III)